MMEISEAVALKVTRIRAKFRDQVTGEETGFWTPGTGFWLRTNEGKYVIVTARHLLDPKLRFTCPKEDPDEWEFLPSTVEVELRWGEDKNPYDPISNQTKFFKVTEVVKRLFFSANDCALLAEPFDERPEKWAHEGMSHFHEADLASILWQDKAFIMLDPVFFIGFPNTWWDQERMLPIARLAHLASMGTFNNDGIKTDDVSLVTGLSFGGSSGSPVISQPIGSPPEGIPHGWPPPSEDYIPSRLVGVMSGHFPFSDHNGPGIPLHAGLSYFTRSTTILALIEEARAKDFRNTVEPRR